jgi:hypothetical protein
MTQSHDKTCTNVRGSESEIDPDARARADEAEMIKQDFRLLMRFYRNPQIVPVAVAMDQKFLDQVMEGLVADGICRIAGTDYDGRKLYELTEAGRRKMMH